KKEAELCEHIRKAVRDEEVAPKQKHVRWCILFCWDNSTSKPFWNGLKGQPIISSGVMGFKAMILIHKVLLDGPHLVLSDAISEMSFLDDIARQGQHSSFHGSTFYSYCIGYTSLLGPYVLYLKAKLAFHRLYPEFNGKFDYKEYINRKGVDSANH
ncbi:unnamed protein product, partial [Sphagnum compactum]